MSDLQDTERVSAEEVREASFPQARRGYDREAVHAFLDRVADWVDTGAAGAASAGPKLTSEFAKVGERTAGILTAAEDSAAKMRQEAKEYAQGLRSSAEEESRKAKLNASQRADEVVAKAESKAERIIDEAVARRRQLNQAVASLLERREEIAGEAHRLADALLEAVESLRTDAPIDEVDDDLEAPAEEQQFEDGDPDAEAERSRLIRAGFTPGTPPGREERTELNPPDQRETRIHDAG